MIHLIITGAKGRMGQAVLACAKTDKNFEVVGQIDVGDDLAKVITRGDVVIDFSAHSATLAVARVAADHKKALVIGTTGHTQSERDLIEGLTQLVPIVWSPNFSVGVNVLFHLTAQATQILGSSYDAEILEVHHRGKTDAPSGTAKRLAEVIAGQRKLTYEKAARHGRAGDVGMRTDAEIGIHAVRGGDVVGDHTVLFATAGERLELTHKAGSRETFARGALRAAQWAVGRKPGLYDMQDVLGLR